MRCVNHCLIPELNTQRMSSHTALAYFAEVREGSGLVSCCQKILPRIEIHVALVVQGGGGTITQAYSDFSTCSTMVRTRGFACDFCDFESFPESVGRFFATPLLFKTCGICACLVDQVESLPKWDQTKPYVFHPKRSSSRRSSTLDKQSLLGTP